MVQAQSTAARNVPAGGSARWPEAPPAWRPRRKYHYRNMAILVGFGCFGIALIVAAFITLPSEPVSNPSPPSTTVATTTAPPKAPVELTPKRLQSDPNIFFSTPFATQSACDEPPTDKRAWLRSALDTILSFGTRVGGSWTSGYNNTHHLISQLSSCERVAEATQRYWKVSWDNFTDSSTPRGPVKFSNIMAEFNQPPRGSDGRRAGYGPKGHLVLTAHWDSKWFADFSFLGACDSATPVAMLLLLMRDVAAQARSLGVDAHVYNVAMPAYTIMFFDGEEAFVEWRDSDNTYGSRHLATLYDKRQDLGKISLFMLLDLLGPVNPTFHNYFGDVTGIDYQRMRGIESSLRSSGKGRRPVKSQPMFPDESGVPYRVEDDHVPWMALGVPILHLIPSPFPGSWHNALDNGANIDDDTAADLYDIISSFALSYSASPATKRRRR